MNAQELSEYILKQLKGLEDIRCTPMLNGYVFYYKNKMFGGIYAKGFMVKDTKAAREAMPDTRPWPPFDGGKDMLPVTIIHYGDELKAMIQAMYPELPEVQPIGKQ